MSDEAGNAFSDAMVLGVIERLRAENEKLRAELEAIKSPPDYGTQKIMNEQIHYAGLIAQKDREIARLRAENEKLQRRIHLFKNTRNEQVFEKLMKAHEEIEKLRARLEKAHSFISRADWVLFFEEEHAAATALKETGDD